MSRPNLSAWVRGVHACVCACVSACALVGTSVESAEAATRTWVGPDAGVWSNVNHWSPSGPIDTGDDLVFPVGAPPSSVNDLTPSIGTLTFESSHFVTPASGSHTITISSGIVAAVMTFPHVTAPINLAASQTWTAGEFAEVSVGWVQLNGKTWTRWRGPRESARRPRWARRRR